MQRYYKIRKQQNKNRPFLGQRNRKGVCMKWPSPRMGCERLHWFYFLAGQKGCRFVEVVAGYVKRREPTRRQSANERWAKNDGLHLRSSTNRRIVDGGLLLFGSATAKQKLSNCAPITIILSPNRIAISAQNGTLFSAQFNAFSASCFLMGWLSP